MYVLEENKIPMTRIASLTPHKDQSDKFTPGLAPSVIKMSSGLAGKPSRALIPAATSSRHALTPYKTKNQVRAYNTLTRYKISCNDPPGHQVYGVVQTVPIGQLHKNSGMILTIWDFWTKTTVGCSEHNTYCHLLCVHSWRQSQAHMSQQLEAKYFQ
jgi:hypothetical protein